MDVKYFCRLIGVPYSKKLGQNAKLSQLVDYVTKENIKFYATENKISENSLIEFLSEINSLKTAVKVLSISRHFPDIEREPKTVAKFFNIYSDCTKYYPGEWMSDLLINEEYLKSVSLEWTRDHILDGAFDKVLVVCKNKSLRVKSNVLSEENEDTYEPSFYANVDSLKSCIKEDKLDKAIKMLSE